MALIRPIKLSDTGIRRAFFYSVGAAWIALLGVVVIALSLVFGKPKAQEDVIATLNGYIDATAVASDYLLLWLGGGPKQVDKLASMTALAERSDLNPDPVTVLSIRPEKGIQRTPAADGQPEVEWSLPMSAVIVPPGSGGSSVRYYYRVTLLQAGSVYKALMYPRPINSASQPVQIESHYTVGVGLDSPMASTVREFLGAYYASGNAGMMGRYVTDTFSDAPIAKSPYSSVEVTSIFAGRDSVDIPGAKPGDEVHLLVTAKAVMSTTTFHWISAPLKMVLSQNRQWLVGGFDDPVRFGAVNYQ